MYQPLEPATITTQFFPFSALGMGSAVAVRARLKPSRTRVWVNISVVLSNVQIKKLAQREIH